MCMHKFEIEFQTQYNDDSTQLIHKYKHLKLKANASVWNAMHFVRHILNSIG